ncbi:hypothetical protein Tco_0680372 [Tanacetum coccineum]|uniref:Uncharacterized protein n=1 Tax=Tanacetum coccineum TaxID=301880 RepID=A0ABQ4XLK2_9ASTR
MVTRVNGVLASGVVMIFEMDTAFYVVSLAWETISEIEHCCEESNINGEELAEYINTLNWNRPIVYYDNDDDEDYTIAITPILLTEELVDYSFRIEDGASDTIPAIEWTNSCKGFYDSLTMGKNFFLTSIDDDSFSIDDIDYVEASPPNYELVSLEVVEIVIPEVRGIDTVIQISSGSPTSYSDLSLPDYEAFFCDSEPDSGNFTMDVVKDIFDNLTRERYVHVLHDLPTLPTFNWILYSLFSKWIPLGSDLVVSFPSGTRNKIFDPVIFIEVQSKRFLSPNEFSISFMRDPLFSVFNTLLPFLSKNEDKVFNPGILASNEETSPHLLSHRGFNPSKIISDFSESPIMISGGDIPVLDDFLDCDDSRARGFVLRSLELQILSFILGIQYPNLID